MSIILEPRSSTTGNVDTYGQNIWTSRALSGCTQTQQSTLSYVATRRLDRFFGYNIDKYHKRKKAGELLPHTTFEKRKYYGTCEPGYLKEWEVSAPSCILNEHTNIAFASLIDPQVYPKPAVDLSAADYYLQASAAKIYSQGHDTLTFISELRKTSEMFKSLAETLRRKRDFAQSKYIDREAANRWLEGRYGWRTLIFDLENLRDAMMNFDEKRKRYSERKGRTWEEIPAPVESVVYAAPTMTLTKVVQDRLTISIRGAVSADIEPPRFDFNPLLTAWELVPYSFVCDWVYNIGQSLSSASFLVLSDAYYGSVGYKVVTNRVTTVSKTDEGSSTTVSGSFTGSTLTETWTDVVRTPRTVPLSPQFSLRLDWLKMVDILAMLTQLKLWR